MLGNSLLRLSNEELIYLLQTMRIDNFPGLDPDPLVALNESQKSLVISVADHALRARGLVSWDGEKQRYIDPEVASLLSECSRPEQTVFVDLLDANKRVNRLLYLFGSASIVEQYEVEPQVQQYLQMQSREEFLKRLQTLLIGERRVLASDLPQGEMSQDLWSEVLHAVRADKDEAGASLARALPEETARELAKALRNLRQLAYLARWTQAPSAEHRDPDLSLTVIQGQAQIFILWLEKPGVSNWRVIPASSEQVWEYIVKLLPCESSLR